jgi:hypothetical protein
MWLFRGMRALGFGKWTCFPLMELHKQLLRKRMSTTLLVQSFGLVGSEYVSHYFDGGATIYRIDKPRNRLRCSVCRSNDVWVAIPSPLRGPFFGPLPVGRRDNFARLKSFPPDGFISEFSQSRRHELSRDGVAG